MTEYSTLRPWKACTTATTPTTGTNDLFTFLTYNILSQNHIHRSCYPYCDSASLKWYQRRELLTEELLSYNSDICCFQEMDRWENFWKLFLQEKMSYDVLATERIKNGCQGENSAPADVNCIAWKKDKFKLIASRSLKSLRSQSLLESDDYDCKALIPNVSQIVALSPINAKNPIILIIATTHLFWRVEGDHIRKEQIRDVVDGMLALSNEIGDAPCEFILAGDLNADPSSLTIKYLMNKNECPLEFRDSSKAAITATPSPSYPLKYTTYCQYIGVLDYILYSSNVINPSHIRSHPDEAILSKEGGLPNHVYASDHIALEVRFSF